MAALIKAVPVVVTGTMPIDHAISTAGGIAWSDVDERLMLRQLPGTFVAGEMLDWEAPTGGYLLQASFSTGVVAARGALAWLGVRKKSTTELVHTKPPRQQHLGTSGGKVRTW
jgi:predicted flavoprotein YhiN